MLYIGVYILILLLALILTNFTRFHLQLVLNNSTTIENFDQSLNTVSYNMGGIKDWNQVFGRNPWLWGVPVYGETGKPIGDGVTWPQTYCNNDQREGFEAEELQENNTKVLHLDISKEDRSLKQSDSDTSFISTNKKVLEINLRKD